ncbi:MAG: hypothetical protein JSV94_05295 [Methanobacteriota archaeon]|nr:MAG: hypothetical protein JSV94_05295 [Euryarchaeota archaeon]
MVDKKFMNAGVVTAVVGGAVLIMAATIMAYPEETTRHGDMDVAQPYFTEGIIVFVIGIVVLFTGVALYAAGKYKNPPLNSHAPASRHQ